METAEMLIKVVVENGAFEGAIQHLGRLRAYLDSLQA